jgi:hypothetical protein
VLESVSTPVLGTAQPRLSWFWAMSHWGDGIAGHWVAQGEQAPVDNWCLLARGIVRGHATLHGAPQASQGCGVGRVGLYGSLEEWWKCDKGWGSEGRWGESCSEGSRVMEQS